MIKFFRNFEDLSCLVLDRNEYSQVYSILDITPDRLISVKQSHSDKIYKVECTEKDVAKTYDALITDKSGLYLMIKVADCQAVCIYEPVKRVIANIHNGWRGSAQNIVGKTIRRMTAEFGCKPENMRITISPSLGPCHAEFSDPYNELPGHLHKYIKENNHVDFWEATKDQCIGEGIEKNNIENPKICTVCNNDKYFSYRAEKEKAGRFGVVIGMV